jgi:putative drug exporter of the RND superfamily
LPSSYPARRCWRHRRHISHAVARLRLRLAAGRVAVLAPGTGRSTRRDGRARSKHAGPTIGAAGLILAGTFASLTLAGNTILSQLGFAVSCGIVLAAFVMAMFFSPSLTTLIGHRAWWPGHADQPRTPVAQQSQKAAP